MMNIIDLIVNQGVSISGLAKIILSMLPEIVLFSLPAACLMSVMLAFIRLSSDNEIIALNASGVSLYQMLPPVIFFSLVSYIAAGFLAIYGIPWGYRSYQDNLQTLTKSKTTLISSALAKERVFHYEIDNVIFYINSSSTMEKEMRDIFIVDKRNELSITTIVAEKGMVITGKSPNTINLLLFNGTVFINEKDSRQAKIIRFDTIPWEYDLGDVAARMASREKKTKEMSLHELSDNLKAEGVDLSKRKEMGIKLYEMFSIPLAIFILGIIGAYLGSHVKARGRTTGVIISLIVFLIYYTSLMGSRYLCEMGIVAPVIGVWTPVLLLLIISLFFLSRVTKNGAFSLFQ
jgi:lipopolysaccharide export system permease protein